MIRPVARRALASGRLPFGARQRLQWRRDHGQWRAGHPATFTGKVRWKMLKDRRALLTRFADKAAARDYVAGVVGPEYLAQEYGRFADADALRRASLPREFVAKVTHGCGGIWLVSDDAPRGGRIVWGERHVPGPKSLTSGWHRVFTRPDEIAWESIAAAFSAWLRWNYADVSLEWAYLKIRPRILVEELLRGSGGASPPDYKLFVFEDRVRLVQVDTNRHGDHRRNLYLPDWTPLDVEYVYRRGAEVPRPASLEEMIRVAEVLGQDVDFVRVDLYEVAGRVVFGELTNYPEAGSGSFDPPSFDEELGAWWHLPARY